jgi:hypothetical protein
MRRLAKLCLVIGLAMTLNTSAGAVVSIGLTQVGGTYSASLGANAGDTLVLDIGWSLQPGDAITGIDPGVVWDDAVASFDAAGSTRTPDWYWGDPPIIIMSGIPPDDVPRQVEPYRATGWGKYTTVAGGVPDPCVYHPSCYSLGTAAFVLSGSSGVVAIGAVGLPYGTVITDGTFMDISGISSLGTFTIVPEPAAASLLGLGLVAVAIARRFRRS